MRFPVTTRIPFDGNTMKKRGEDKIFTWYIDEPRGETYRSLLRYMQVQVLADEFILVTEEDEEVLAECLSTVHRISRFTNNSVLSKSWPGNPSGTRSRVYRFRFNRESSELLGKLVDGIFDWKYPGKPEDFSLILAGRERLVSVTHERMCWLRMTESELHNMTEKVPTLRISQGPGYRGGR
jgi:hypothetical protein